MKPPTPETITGLVLAGGLGRRMGRIDKGLALLDGQPMAARVLERFYRVQGTLGEGNGLGLAIADEIARAHHRHLELQGSTDSRGLKVTLSFTG